MDRDGPTEGPLGHLRLGAVVLAAGAGRRFGGRKLGAELHGRPLLQHVLDTLDLVRPVMTVVVLGPDVGGLERIAWRETARIDNPDPGRGLSSSVRLGLDACVAVESLDGVFILLGDQPLTTTTTLVALSSAAPDAIRDGALAVVPDYADGGGANPVLLLRAGFPLAAGLVGDHGLGSALAHRPDQVRLVPLPGSNPDVDTLADLRTLEAGS
jgi:molybdenum cofactor cytidylyltransferase